MVVGTNFVFGWEGRVKVMGAELGTNFVCILMLNRDF